MSSRNLRVSGRPIRPYTIPEFIRDELRDDPLTLRQVALGLLGMGLVLLLVVLFLSTGEVPG